MGDKQIETGNPDSQRNTKKEPDYNPYLHRNVKHPLNDIEALINFMKGCLDNGVLAMPMAFKTAGLWAGVIGSVAVSFICTYCIAMIVNCSYILCQRNKIPSIGIQEIAKLSFLEGPKCLRKFASIAGYIMKSALLIEMLGCCTAYVIFVAKSTKQINEYYFDVDFNLNVYFLAMLLPLTAINCLRSLKHLTPLSTISNLFFLVGVIISYFYIFKDLPPISERPSFSSINQLPTFVGTTIFAFEGIGVVMPVENSMKTPRHFTHRPGILFIGMTILTAVYVITGFFGYLKYGDATEPSITLNLPIDALLGQILKILVTIAVFFSYALLFYVAMELIGVANGRIFKSNRLLYEYISRIILVWTTVLAAALFPSLGAILSLIGSLGLCSVGLIFPPIIDTLVYWNIESSSRWRYLKNLIILIFGTAGLITGTITSLKEFALERNHSS